MEVRKYVAPEILFGKDVRFLAAQFLRNFEIPKVMVVTDETVRKQYWFKEITDSLEEKDIQYVIYPKVTPNPHDEEVMSGVEVFTYNNCKGILAIGGGSPIDCAKAIGIVASNGQNVLSFEGIDKVRIPGPPIVCIPSTAGASADVSQFSIIRDMKRLVKIAIISKALVPDVSLIDPVTSLTMDSYLTACTGLDALTHSIEAYVSNAHSIITDNHALNAMRIIKTNLDKALKNPDDLKIRYNLHVASLEAGLAFSNASLGAVHAMAHSLGGYYNLMHGELNAILLSHVIDFNFSVQPDRFNAIAGIFDVPLKGVSESQRKKLLLDKIRSFVNSSGVTSTLEKKGVKRVDIPLISKNAIHDPCIITNPRKVVKEDLETIISNAM